MDTAPQKKLCYVCVHSSSEYYWVNRSLLYLEPTKGAAQHRGMVAIAVSIELCTVEPPNKGHFGASHVVLGREIVLFSEV